MMKTVLQFTWSKCTSSLPAQADLGVHLEERLYGERRAELEVLVELDAVRGEEGHDGRPAELHDPELVALVDQLPDGERRAAGVLQHHGADARGADGDEGNLADDGPGVDDDDLPLVEEHVVAAARRVGAHRPQRPRHVLDVRDRACDGAVEAVVVLRGEARDDHAAADEVVAVAVDEDAADELAHVQFVPLEPLARLDGALEDERARVGGARDGAHAARHRAGREVDGAREPVVDAVVPQVRFDDVVAHVDVVLGDPVVVDELPFLAGVGDVARVCDAAVLGEELHVDVELQRDGHLREGVHELQRLGGELRLELGLHRVVVRDDAVLGDFPKVDDHEHRRDVEHEQQQRHHDGAELPGGHGRGAARPRVLHLLVAAEHRAPADGRLALQRLVVGDGVGVFRRLLLFVLLAEAAAPPDHANEDERKRPQQQHAAGDDEAGHAAGHRDQKVQDGQLRGVNYRDDLWICKGRVHVLEALQRQHVGLDECDHHSVLHHGERDEEVQAADVALVGHGAHLVVLTHRGELHDLRH
mmetsp:Transcript_37800/g.116793  ORF Transcript_37800/g.116793 Transcript_37800/m.116793 type:complete len:531 (-) Transcript_37800:124-1716(-)